MNQRASADARKSLRTGMALLVIHSATMMSLDGVSKLFCFRPICPHLTVMALASGLLPIPVVAQDTGDSPAPTPGLHSLILSRADKPAMHYAISIPPGYSRDTPVPLILALHFGVGGGVGAGAGRDVVRILIGPALGDLGAIIVAPDSLRGDWSTPENEEGVTELLDMVVRRYAIDKKRVVVTGYSMGGTGSWHFAEKFPGRFSAAIPIASRPPASPAGWRLPVLAIHSDADQVAPFAPVAARIEELQRAGVNAKMITLGGITHYQVPRFRGALHQAIPWLQEVWK